MTVNITPAFLDQLAKKLPRPGVTYLCPALVCTALGHGGETLGTIYNHAVTKLPPAPNARSHSPLPSKDTIPRRLVLREIKEALIKSSCLIGIPKVIEALLDLADQVEEGAKDDAFVREALTERLPTEQIRVGRAGLDRVYKDDIVAIFAKMGQDMRDVQYLSQVSTYGTLLVPHDLDASSSPDPLERDRALLSVVTLSGLIPQRTSREILWHLRGAIRNGMSRDEVETLHQAIESICEACGVPNVGKGMPRVADIELQPEEEGYVAPTK